MSAAKFLQRVPLSEARRLVVENAPALDRESVDAASSLGRIAAVPVHAVFASPHYRASAMDGIAVRAADTAAASDNAPLGLREIGLDATPPAEGPVFVSVDTGTALPAWTDAVVRVENTKTSPEGVTIVAPVGPGRDVRAVGEDIESGAILFARGHRIRPFDIGAMLATGVGEIEVLRRPRVGLIATGAEIVEPGTDPEPGSVIEYNSRVIAAMVTEWGGYADYLGRVPDEATELTEAIAEGAALHDVVCVIAGSSAGSKDLTVDALGCLGEILFHGVDMMPGKPTALAVIGGCAVLGVPGYPVSAALSCQQLLRPLLAASLGTAEPLPATMKAAVRRKLPSRLGVEEFLRVCIAGAGNERIVAPLPRGAGSVSTLVRADALLRIPATSEGVDAGATVTVELLRPANEIAGTVVVGGAPDIITATIEDVLRREAGPARLARMAHLSLADHDAVLALATGEVQLVLFECTQRRGDLDALADRHASGSEAFEIRSGEPTGCYRLLLAAGFAATTLGSAIAAACEDGRVATALGDKGIASVVKRFESVA